MASMEPLLICCLMAHRSRKNGSPTVSWVGRGCQGAEAQPASPHSSLPRLQILAPEPLVMPQPQNTFTTLFHRHLHGCLLTTLFLDPSTIPSALESAWTLRLNTTGCGQTHSFHPPNNPSRYHPHCCGSERASHQPRVTQQETGELGSNTGSADPQACDFLLSLPR